MSVFQYYLLGVLCTAVLFTWKNIGAPADNKTPWRGIALFSALWPLLVVVGLAMWIRGDLE